MIRLAEHLKSSVMSLPLIGHAYVFLGSGESKPCYLKLDIAEMRPVHKILTAVIRHTYKLPCQMDRRLWYL